MNQPTKKLRVAVIFGGKSAEHEISIITAHQIMAAVEVAGFGLLPIYISKAGRWFAGKRLNDLTRYRYSRFNPADVAGVVEVYLRPDPSNRGLIAARQGWWPFSKKCDLAVDVFFPAIHGTFGEDGTLQGLLEIAGVPFVGSGVLASALGMDKAITKLIARAVNVPVLPAITLLRSRWLTDRGACVAEAELLAPYPLIVKPVRLGSSIAVSRCDTRESLEAAVDVAAKLDSQVLVEPALSNFVELNCSVQSSPERVSVCEQPCTNDSLLTFDAKYRRGGKKKMSSVRTEGMAAAERLIPAPVDTSVTERVERYALAAFRAIGASGVSRIDFLYQKQSDSLYLNELNTMPGSLAYYLWEASGVPFEDLIKSLIDEALDRHRIQEKTQYTFASNVLAID